MKGLYSINLITSMRVDRAEIATRGNVMLIGDNDAGKTVALRLWIYKDNIMAAPLPSTTLYTLLRWLAPKGH